MKCNKCGFENKNEAKFCTKCGNSLIKTNEESISSKSNSSRYIIIALIVIIIILAGTVGYFMLNMGENSQDSVDSGETQSVDNTDENESAPAKTESVASTKRSTEVVDSKEWVSIGSYSGSGTGSQTISVPEGKIMVKLSAFPIKNYATNHLYVDGSNGESGAVDWGSKSAVETRSDSFTYTSSSEEIFTIDYYETVSWEVEFFRYQ